MMGIVERARVDTGHAAHVGELLQHIRRLPTVGQDRTWKLVYKVMLAVDTAIDAATVYFPPCVNSLPWHKRDVVSDAWQFHAIH